MRRIDYLDTIRATKRILWDWRDQHWLAEHGKEKVSQISEAMVRLSSLPDSVPVQGGGNKAQEILCTQIDRKDLAETGYRRAEEFVTEIEPAWEQLTEEEQYLLTVRFIDRDERNGIQKIMERYSISRAEAYNRSNVALQRFSAMLFWKS